MFLLKLANTSLVHHYVNCFAVGRRFRSLFVKKSLYFGYKKRDACNFLTYSFDWDSVDRLHSEYSDGFQPIQNSCVMQYLDNIKLSTRDREEYAVYKNL